jgi:hypothetical protein
MVILKSRGSIEVPSVRTLVFWSHVYPKFNTLGRPFSPHALKLGTIKPMSETEIITVDGLPGRTI